MAAEEKISSYIDTESTKKETDILVGYIDTLIKKFDEVNTKTITLSNVKGFSDFKTEVKETVAAVNDYSNVTKLAVDQQGKLVATIKQGALNFEQQRSLLDRLGGSLDDNIKLQVQYKVRLEEISKELKILNASSNVAEKNTKTYQNQVAELVSEQLNLKTANQELNVTIRNQIKENQAAEGSIDQLQARMNQLQQVYEQLSSDEQNSPYGVSLKNSIEAMLPVLKEAEGGIGKFVRNVGNYAGALKPAFNALITELSNVKSQLNGLNNTDPGFDKLKSEADLLEKVIESVDKTFSSTKQEMRAFTEAAKVLGQEFGTTNELFQNFIQEVGSQKDTLDDIQNTINFNASDTKYLDGIVSGISGIVGAYGAWQAATQLVAGDNEELQKSMAKLQAILTLVQSLQAVLNAVQTESGAIQTALAAKTALVSAAKKVETIVFGGATAAIATNTVATEANAVAQVSLASAEGAAAAGAISLRTAIISTGIGALVIGIVFAITKLVGVVSDWVGADERAIESQKDLADALNEVAQAQIELTEEVRKGVLERIAIMERELAVVEARGVTAAKQLALENQIAQAKLNASLQEQIQNEVTEASRQGIHENYMVAKKKEKAILEEIAQMNLKAAKEGEKVDEDELESVNNRLALAQSITAGLEKEYQYQTDLLKTQTDAEQTLALNKAKAEKMAADDRRKLALETAKIESDLVITKNNVILNSEKSTITQRIEALRSNLAEQKKIAAAENANIQNDPTASETDKEIAKKKFNQISKKLSIEEKTQELKITQDYNKKIEESNFNIAKSKIEASIKANENIINNEFESADTRYKAVASFIDNSKKLEEESYQFKKKKIIDSIPDVELRNKEIELLDADHHAKLIAITADGEAKKLEVTKSYLDQQEELNKKFREFILQTNSADVERVQDYSADVQALNKSLQERKISKQKYDEELLALDNSYAEKSIQAEIDKQRKLIEIGGLSGTEKQDALIKLANLEKDLSNATTKTVLDNEEKKRAKLLETLDQVKQVTDEVSQAVQSILGSGIEKQKQQVQSQIDDIDRQKEAEIEAANASALTAQEKADKIATINAVAQSKKEALERRQRELDNQKAKQDKIFAIFNVVTNTAAAIVKAVAASPLTGGLPFSAIAGAIGAAQLAAIIAQPIPKYAKGRKGGPAEFAIVGEEGTERIDFNDGTSVFTPDKPSLAFLPEGASVIPHHKTMMDALATGSLISMANASGNAVHERDFDYAYLQAVERKLDQVTKAIKTLPITQLVPDGFGGTTRRVKNKNGWIEYVEDYFIN